MFQFFKNLYSFTRIDVNFKKTKELNAIFKEVGVKLKINYSFLVLAENKNLK